MGASPLRVASPDIEGMGRLCRSAVLMRRERPAMTDAPDDEYPCPWPPDTLLARQAQELRSALKAAVRLLQQNAQAALIKARLLDA